MQETTMNPVFTRKLVVISLICIAFAASAHGEGRVISRAYEVALDLFQAPQSENGMATFKECADCDLTQVPVTAATRYSVDGRSVRLDEFRLALLQTGDREAGSITVLHHLETNRVESVDAWL